MHRASHAYVVYRFFDADGVLLYVGCSGQAVNRLQQHANARGNEWKRVSRAELTHYDSKDRALSAERIAIHNENPLWNRTAIGSKAS